MDQDELSFNAWILIGNVLHAMLHGPLRMPALPRGPELQRIEAALADVQPAAMLAAIADLPPADRAELAEACRVAFELAGEHAATLLGMDRAEAEPVMEMLRT